MSAGTWVTPSQARSFLEALFEEKPSDLYVLLWTLQDKTSHWFQDVERAVQFAESTGDVDIYVGVGFSSTNHGPSKRCVADEIAGIVGMWADIDLKSEAHAKTSLPATVEQGLQILPKELPPTFVVRTGNGLHAWWLFKEPLIFEGDEERREAAGLVTRWQTLLRLNASAFGWGFDRLADLARVLRIPGTQNCKDPKRRKPVQIDRQTEQRYNPSEFAEFLEEHGVPDPEELKRVTQAWKTQFADKPLLVDLNATVPEDLLARCMEADPRFQKTWTRQRDDLKDSSQSGYDLALANFGFQGGLSEQQVVAMIVHHRRVHAQRPRTRLEYFQRTIAKAFKRFENVPQGFAEQHLTSESGWPSLSPAPNSATARALLCDQISEVVGVPIIRIVKIEGQEPTYRVELETAKVTFGDVDKLINQKSFRTKIASAVQHLMPRTPAKVWDRIAQTMLKALVIEDGGDEASLEGSARICVERYLSEAQFIDPEERLMNQTRYKPIVYEGQIAICSNDFQQHLNKSGAESRAIKDITAMLSVLGASTFRLKRTQLRDQSRWLLPSETFAPEAYIEAGEVVDAGPN